MRGVPKQPYVSNKEYLRWVASYPCASCGIEGFSQAAHSNQPRHGHGRGVKSSDIYTFPLCCARPGHQGCHYMHDNCIDMTRAQRREKEDEYIEHMHVYARRDGWGKVIDGTT